jgi:hypothetical protein
MQPSTTTAAVAVTPRTGSAGATIDAPLTTSAAVKVTPRG